LGTFIMALLQCSPLHDKLEAQHVEVTRWGPRC
jgi:hypothetical protein